MSSLTSLATRHLYLRLQPILRLLRRGVARQIEASSRLSRPDLAAVCIPTEQAQLLLDDIQANAEAQVPPPDGELTPAERDSEELLRAEASAAGGRLPLDRLADELALDAFELQSLLVCAAPEIDSAYQRVFAFVLDDMQRLLPCVELLASLGAAGPDDRLARRAALGPAGRLQRLGLLERLGTAPIEWRQELRLGDGVFDLLLGRQTGLARFRDAAEVPLPRVPLLPLDVDAHAVAQLAGALADGRVAVAGVWGPSADGREEIVTGLALAAGRALRRLNLVAATRPSLRAQLEVAAALDAIVCVATDELAQPPLQETATMLAEELASTTVPVCLSGLQPWRPAALLAERAYAELVLPRASFAARKQSWRTVLPEISDECAADHAGRFRLGRDELLAVANMARTTALLSDENIERALPAATAAVVRRQVDRLARTIVARRRPSDLVLAPELHRQVIEVGRFFRAWPRLAEEWALGRVLAGTRGVKALFTGDPGTGKTLAAEVIAGIVGLPLLKVDLANVTSKWVGETEKNLDSVFHEAEASHSVLFFDEAEALFGRRGEVQHGTDRYANLEVSYLLQRLEEYDGLVILASNLKDQIDAAFTRRFHTILHFPRPRENERLQMWRQTLPPGVVDGDVDMPWLARLDLTGAGIVNSVRTAVLLAAQEGAASLGMAHLIEAIARQYRREARVLSAAELGPHRNLLATGN